jgi:putative lipase involved disintegration of autophagic bodies
VATDATNNITVIAFQGTETSKQIKVDLNLSLSNTTDICDGCKAHSGFWQSWQEARPKVLEAISSARKKFPTNKLIVTGHSLGGAISTVAVADLRSNGIPVDLVKNKHLTPSL